MVLILEKLDILKLWVCDLVYFLGNAVLPFLPLEDDPRLVPMSWDTLKFEGARSPTKPMAAKPL
jgi:hypothetical protein